MVLRADSGVEEPRLESATERERRTGVMESLESSLMSFEKFGPTTPGDASRRTFKASRIEERYFEKVRRRPRRSKHGSASGSTSSEFLMAERIKVMMEGIDDSADIKNWFSLTDLKASAERFDGNGSAESSEMMSVRDENIFGRSSTLRFESCLLMRLNQ